MAKWLLPVLATSALHAAIIRGMVVEHQSGKPLARALVVVQPVAGTQGPMQAVRTSVYGTFEFAPMPGGAYLVTASRRGFATVEYGQKQWRSAGVPIVLEEAASTALNIRLPRFGAIAGTVLDENSVGLPEHDVVIYRNTRPPQVVARGKTDDRGMYRIWGLEPGTYLVRTVGKQYEEGGSLPTFHRETSRVEEAFTVDVDLDRDTGEINVRPFTGRLFTVAGKALAFPQSGVTVTLVSDTGTETTMSDGSGNFQFNPVAPGQYELYAQAAGDSRTPMTAAYQPLDLDRDRGDLRLNLARLPDVVFSFEETNGKAVDARSLQVLARRKDLSGDEKPEVVRLTNNHASMLPGRWDLALAPTPGYYAARFTGPPPQFRVRADGWNEVTVTAPAPVPSAIQFVLSSRPGAVHGTVTGPGRDPVAGAPVYLEAYDLEARRRLNDVRTTRTDLRGQFHFYGLAPGNYRAVSSFEFQAPDSAALDTMRPATVKVDEGQDAAQDLDLYVIQ
jgi:protocatechuate 3,4-dioxygenase beta subunit